MQSQSVSGPVMRDLICLCCLDLWFLKLSFVLQHSLYGRSFYGLLVHVLTWKFCHKCDKHGRHQLCGSLQCDQSCDWSLTSFHKCCISRCLLYQSLSSWIWFVHLDPLNPGFIKRLLCLHLLSSCVKSSFGLGFVSSSLFSHWRFDKLAEHFWLVLGFCKNGKWGLTVLQYGPFHSPLTLNHNLPALACCSIFGKSSCGFQTFDFFCCSSRQICNFLFLVNQFFLQFSPFHTNCLLRLFGRSCNAIVETFAVFC